MGYAVIMIGIFLIYRVWLQSKQKKKVFGIKNKLLNFWYNYRLPASITLTWLGLMLGVGNLKISLMEIKITPNNKIPILWMMLTTNGVAGDSMRTMSRGGCVSPDKSPYGCTKY
jgi:hypothetical protein